MSWNVWKVTLFVWYCFWTAANFALLMNTFSVKKTICICYHRFYSSTRKEIFRKTKRTHHRYFKNNLFLTKNWSTVGQLRENKTELFWLKLCNQAFNFFWIIFCDLCTIVPYGIHNNCLIARIEKYLWKNANKSKIELK